MSSNLQIAQQTDMRVRSDQTSNSQISLQSSTVDNNNSVGAENDFERAVTLVESNDDGRPLSPTSARNVRLEKRGPPFSRLEREAQMDVFIDEENEKGDSARPLQKVAALFNTGANVLIVSGIVAITLAALFIWPGAVAVRQSKRLKRYESTMGAPTSSRPQTRTAHVMAILTAILGALGTLVALGSAAVGLGALSFGVLLSFAMLVIGIIAAHRLGAQNASETDEAIQAKNAGKFSHAASALWITAMVIGLLIPGIAGVAFGSKLKSKIAK